MKNKIQNSVSLIILFAGLGLMSLGPYGGCSCQNPVGTTSGPTPTATPDHGPMIDDFEDVNTFNNFGGSIEFSFDSYPVALAPSGSIQGGNVGSSLPNGTGGAAVRLAGEIAPEIGPPTNQYPYNVIVFNLDGPVDLAGYAPGREVRFHFKANSTTQVFRVDFVTSDVADFSNYQSNFRVTVANAWEEFVIKFPDHPGVIGYNPLVTNHTPGWAQSPASVVGTGGWFDQPSWGVPRDWAVSKNVVSSLRFQIVPGGTAQNYEFWVDDIWFQ